MRKVIAHCSIGYTRTVREKTFEFEDGLTEREIADKIYEWANQFLQVWWDDEDEEWQ